MTNYRCGEDRGLTLPHTNPVFWSVWDKHNPQNKTKVFTKYWFDARRMGSIALMISLEHCEANCAPRSI